MQTDYCIGNETIHLTTASQAQSFHLADAYNSTIRQIIISTSAVTTLAGTAEDGTGGADGTVSEAQFGWLAGITTYGTILDVVDTINNTIREIRLMFSLEPRREVVRACGER